MFRLSSIISFNVRYPSLETSRLLLQCGADVHAVDCRGNTPLHVFVSNEISNGDGTLLRLLCDSGAHVDCVNHFGETSYDCANDPMIKQLLKNQMYLNLKCSCARLIRREKLSFRDQLSSALVHFVGKHCNVIEREVCPNRSMILFDNRIDNNNNI